MVFFCFAPGGKPFSPSAFYSILKPFFSKARGTANSLFRKSRYSSPRPDFLQVRHPAHAERQQRTSDYLNRIIEFFPDRLASEKWARNFNIEGLDHWQAARREGRGVVLGDVSFRALFFVAGFVASCRCAGGRIDWRKISQTKAPAACAHGTGWQEAGRQIHLRIFERQTWAVSQGATEILYGRSASDG